MGRIRRDIAVMTQVQAESFAKLAAKVTNDLGAVGAMKALGISTTTYYQLMNERYITDKQAATLMDGYRKYKASRALAA